jgi:hypothetical protein
LAFLVFNKTHISPCDLNLHKNNGQLVLYCYYLLFRFYRHIPIVSLSLIAVAEALSFFNSVFAEEELVVTPSSAGIVNVHSFLWLIHFSLVIVRYREVQPGFD